MQFNDKGITLLKEFEGEKLSVYLDSAGLPTIGIGHLIKAGEHFTTITSEQSEELLRKDLAVAINGVTEGLRIAVNDNQFSAMVCFAFNCGVNGFKASTLLKLVNAGQFDEAALQFLRWNKAGGKEVAGLTRRRKAEAALFLDGDV